MNPRATKADVKYLRFLTTTKGRDEARKFLLEGWRPLVDALKSDFSVEAVYYTKAAERNLKNIEAILHDRKIPLREMTESDLDRVTATEQAQGIIAILRQIHISPERACAHANLVIALERVNNPGNVGTVIRTADWFGADAVLLNDLCASLYNEKVIRSTAGSIFHLPIAERVDLAAAINSLRARGFAVWGTDSQGTNIGEVNFTDKLLLIFGSEGAGLTQELRAACDGVLAIPPFGRAESLNVATAASAILSFYRLTK